MVTHICLPEFFPHKNLKTVLSINVTKDQNVIKAKRTGLVFRKEKEKGKIAHPMSGAHYKLANQEREYHVRMFYV